MLEEVCVHVAVNIHGVVTSSSVIDNLRLIVVVTTTLALLLQNVLYNLGIQIFFEELGKHRLEIRICATQMLSCGRTLVERLRQFC